MTTEFPAITPLQQSKTWHVGRHPSGRGPLYTIQLPEAGGAVKGLYMGVPFVGTLLSARFHSYNGDLLLHISFADDQHITVFGMDRDGCSVSLCEDGSDRRRNFCEMAK